MRLRQGNMFDHSDEYDVILVTTNAKVRKDGELVMGRGAALEAAQRWPWLPRELGRLITNRPKYGVIIPSLVIFNPGGSITTPASGHYLGAFQVKDHWRDPADLDLITSSVWKLNHLAHTFPDMKFALNFPGIGNGKLERDKVLPQLDILPDNVDIWEL